MSAHTEDEATSPIETAATNSNIVLSLEDIIQLTRHELTTAQEGDSIIECGRAALFLLRANPDLAAKLAYQKLHDVPYKDVKICWRRLYTDAALWRALNTAESQSNQKHADEPWIDEIVNLLDMTLILTTAPVREELVELWFAALEEYLSASEPGHAEPKPTERPAKKLKIDNANPIRLVFPAAVAKPPLTSSHNVIRCDNMSMSAFQKRLSSPATHTPLIIEHAIQHWPAISERPWSDPNYLLKRTLGGRRLVPIETGRSYTDSGWGQKIITFKDFMSIYMLCNSDTSQTDTQTGYLAQHDLFAQVPALRADISVPDLCYCDPAPSPLAPIKKTPKLEDPILNAWFGPKGTISPLHTDPYHNILAQVVGYKYVRLYAPEQTEWIHPRSVDENGVDMSNTSLVDLDKAMETIPEIGLGTNFGSASKSQEGIDSEQAQSRRQQFEEQFPGFAAAKYIEGIIGPGECLYLPPGWWHYVKSLSPSFSVSFWFN